MPVFSNTCVAWTVRGPPLAGRRALLRSLWSLLGFCEPLLILRVDPELSDRNDRALAGLRGELGELGAVRLDVILLMGVGVFLELLKAFAGERKPRVEWVLVERLFLGTALIELDVG